MRIREARAASNYFPSRHKLAIGRERLRKESPDLLGFAQTDSMARFVAQIVFVAVMLC
jgi:hypothetical protein